MPQSDPRAILDALILAEGCGYAAISRLIGRNSAYIQQFIHRGTPRKLDERDRRTLAQFFDVDEELLGGPPTLHPRETTLFLQDISVRNRANLDMLLAVKRLDLDAPSRPNMFAQDQHGSTTVTFQARWLRSVTNSDPAVLAMISIKGDSMAPTLQDGDEILVDRSDVASRLRDGVYVLRMDTGLLVKRVAYNPLAHHLSIRSDNPAYPPWESCDPQAIEVVGRVIWVGHRLV